jgi:hypothetical protein
MSRVAAVFLALLVALGTGGSALAGAAVLTRNPRFCAPLAHLSGALTVLGGPGPIVSASDAASVAPAITSAAAASPVAVKRAGRVLASAYTSVARGGSTNIFVTPAVQAAASTFLAYDAHQCLPLTAVRQATQQALDLTVTGALNTSFTVPDAANECTVSTSQNQLSCELAPRASLDRFAITVSPYPGPGTFDAAAPIAGATSLTLHVLDENGNLAATFTAVAGQIVIQRGDRSAGPVLRRNAGAAGTINAQLASTSADSGSGTMQLSGSFACPLSGG